MAHHLADDLTLAFRPADVSARIGIAHPDVGERLRTAQFAAAGRQIEPGEVVLQRDIGADLNTAYRVHEVGEAIEADLQVAIQADPGDQLDGLGEQGGATVGVRGVQFVLTEARDRHVGVPWEADQHRAPRGRLVEQHDGVGAHAGEIFVPGHRLVA